MAAKLINEEFEYTKGGNDNTMAKGNMTKGQVTMYKLLH
jgi:hypothetical protein